MDESDSRPAIDLSYLNRTIRNPERRKKVLEQYVEANKNDAAELLAAIDGRDAARIARAAHRLKGAARTIGARPLAGASEWLEEAGSRSAMEGVLERYPMVIREIERVNAAITEQSTSSSAAGPSEAAAGGHVGTASSQAGHRLLLVDDDERIRSVVGEILRGHGYSVQTVADGVEALRMVAKDASLEVVLLDVSMPGMNGLEVLRELTSRDRRPGVIMLTSVQDAEIARQAIEQGAFDYVVKAANLEELASSIAVCLDHIEYEKQPWWKRLF